MLYYYSKRKVVTKLRVTKAPEDRKQEIIDTALLLFQERGYEKTPMSEIAKEMNVAQGLCYRYFPSKEALFDTALDQYAQLIVDRIKGSLKEIGIHTSLKDYLQQLPTFMDAENEEDSLYQICHNSQDTKFHEQLSLKVCEKLLPIVEKQLSIAKENGIIHVSDIPTVASFFVYGQLGLLLRNDLTNEEKTNAAISYFTYVLER